MSTAKAGGLDLSALSRMLGVPTGSDAQVPAQTPAVHSTIRHENGQVMR